GDPVADLWDGPGRSLLAGAWSPVPGDQRLIVVHERTGVARPAIWAPETGGLEELRFDLPGDVDADWFWDAGALLRVHDVAGPHPTVFAVHGGPTAHDHDAWSPAVQAWVDHGFAVVLVNYRGSTGYGREWRDALEGNPGLTELQDLRAVRDHLVAAGVADPG